MIHKQNDGKGERGKGERSKECVEVTRPPLFKFQSGRNYYGIMPPYCLRCELGRPCSWELLKELTSNNTCFLNTPPFPLSLWKHCSLHSSPPLIFTFRPPCYTYRYWGPYKLTLIFHFLPILAIILLMPLHVQSISMNFFENQLYRMDRYKCMQSSKAFIFSFSWETCLSSDLAAVNVAIH